MHPEAVKPAYILENNHDAPLSQNDASLDPAKRAHLGTRIKALRKKNNLSQKELALLCGVSKTAVFLWESGISKSLDTEVFFRLIAALKIRFSEAEYLYFGESGMPQIEVLAPVLKRGKRAKKR